MVSPKQWFIDWLNIQELVLSKLEIKELLVPAFKEYTGNIFVELRPNFLIWKLLSILSINPEYSNIGVKNIRIGSNVHVILDTKYLIMGFLLNLVLGYPLGSLSLFLVLE